MDVAVVVVTITGVIDGLMGAIFVVAFIFESV